MVKVIWDFTIYIKELKIVIYIRKPMSSIKNFNTKINTEPRKRGGCSAWLAKASYADKIFMR